VHRDIAFLDLDRRQAADAFKRKLADFEQLADLLAFMVVSREEIRDVECFETPAPSRMTVELFRADTGAFVSSRPMTAEEREAVLNPPLPGIPPYRQADELVVEVAEKLNRARRAKKEKVGDEGPL